MAYRPPRSMITVMTCLAVLYAAPILLLVVAGAVIDTMHERHVPQVSLFGGTVDTAALVAYGCCGFVLALLLCTLVDVEHWMWIVSASVFTILLMAAVLAEGVSGDVVLSMLFCPVAFAGVRQLRLDRRRAGVGT